MTNGSAFTAPGYGPPPSYGGFPGAAGPPGMAPPPGLGPPPGMSSAPGMAPPPGVHQPSATQANRPSGLPPNFQTPANLPNINFNAKVIRLGTSTPKPSTPTGSGRRGDDGPGSSAGPRAGLGADRGGDHGRSSARESAQTFIPFSHEERLRTVFVHKVPESVSGDIERILNAVGKVRRWDSAASVLSESTGTKFGFALYDDAESFANAIDLLKDVDVPAKRQQPTEPDTEQKEGFDGIEKVKLQISVDENSIKYAESYKENRGNDAGASSRLEAARAELQRVIRELFYPPPAKRADKDGDVAMGDSNGENVEVVNIPLTQEDELADIPAEMREIVAGEIAAFRERSNKRDMERMKREEEMEEMERMRSNRARSPRASSPGGTNNIPLGPRGLQNIPSGPKGQNGSSRGVTFVNGEGTFEDDTDASDEELHRRELAKQKSEDDQMYLEAERKWVNRERSRAAALGREKDREKQEAESLERRRQEQLEREKAWDDEKESARKAHLYYRDHAAWARKRTGDRADEQARDQADRRAEEEEKRRETVELERTRGMADSFLDQQAKEMEQREAAPAPQPFKLSLGAAAQRAQAQRAAPQRRTIAEVEGLLDDEEQDQTAKRQLIPIQFEPSTTSSMSEEELSKAMRALAQEIPTEKEGLWRWDVQWDHLDDAIMREKLRPFVEKKIVEYLGVQEEVIVEVIEEHLRNHGKPGDLVEELAEALDDEAEDLVKKLWRMVIFFTESEKRGLPA
ncbi:hypothetical protein jhhlp_006000 [Lomentospora prolificans]|uniref:PWI domain-containing protein n=1 Tax=Lomentospora prolificans TaxID=41688 RepID=A0A2N3N4P5_9PEZI|nr:hypothetical protein jhhlp_006000 [Lomentospora prolificans]